MTRSVRLGGGEGSEALLGVGLVLRGLDDLELTGSDVVNDTMEFEVSGSHSIDNSWVHPEDVQAAQDVVLAQTQALCGLIHLFEFFGVLHSELSHRLQPDIKETKTGVAESGVDTTTAGVAADKDVLDLEMGDGELYDGERVDVGRRDNIGNVAVHKDLTGLQAEDGGLGNTGVCASNPKNGGRLTGSGASEEIRLRLGRLCAPLGHTAGESVGKPLC